MMGLFGKKVKNTTLMLNIMLFEDFDHQCPAGTAAAAKAFSEPIIMDVVREHYYEALRPPKKWNYDYNVKVIKNMTDPAYSRFDFRDRDKKQINDRAKYAEMCSSQKMLWKEQLLERFPKYDRRKFEDGFEDIRFTYFPERCILAASVLMDDIMKPKEEFRS